MREIIGIGTALLLTSGPTVSSHTFLNPIYNTIPFSQRHSCVPPSPKIALPCFHTVCTSGQPTLLLSDCMPCVNQEGYGYPSVWAVVLVVLRVPDLVRGNNIWPPRVSKRYALKTAIHTRTGILQQQRMPARPSIQRQSFVP